MQRLAKEDVEEVITATNLSLRGEDHKAMYISKPDQTHRIGNFRIASGARGRRSGVHR